MHGMICSRRETSSSRYIIVFISFALLIATSIVAGHEVLSSCDPRGIPIFALGVVPEQ